MQIVFEIKEKTVNFKSSEQQWKTVCLLNCFGVKEGKIYVVKKVVIAHRSKYNSNVCKVYIVCLTMWSLELYIATFRLLTARLLQAMKATGCASPYESRWTAVTGAFPSSLFWCEVVSREVRFEVVPSAVC